jgi:lysozyme
MALGIDIYRSNQTVTDWDAVHRHGVTFVYVKLSDGGGQPVGGPGDHEVAGARRVGIPVGGYHFVQANPGPQAQADVFLGEVTRLGATGLVPMLDLEDNPPQIAKPNMSDAQKRTFGIAFCEHVAARGFRPGVYLNNALAKLIRPDQWDVPGLVIWIARFGHKPDEAAGRYDIHQFSDAGTVPGIAAKAVDLNESFTDNHFAGTVAGTARKATELMERRTLAASPSTTSVRLLLSGSETSAIVIRPKLDAKGFTANPVFLGNVFAWASDHNGIGHNPMNVPGYDGRVVTHRRLDLPGAVWADFEYSSNDAFDVDIVG